MKQELIPPPDLTDPLAVLGEILDKPLRGEEGEEAEAVILDKPAELIEDVDFAGLSLRQYVVQEVKASEEHAESILTIEECEYVWP